ncbi:MAG: GntR family transcriptional regulator [Actinobacteria bacterium]|nr:GntR family transcriptional regulator [Actinomycetota bacterium]
MPTKITTSCSCWNRGRRSWQTARLTEAELEDLERLSATLNETASRRICQRVELKAEFHRRIYVAVGRPRLTKMIDGLREALSRFVALAISGASIELREMEEHEHRDIVDALGSGDGARASAAMERHLRRGVDLIAELVVGAEAEPAERT